MAKRNPESAPSPEAALAHELAEGETNAADACTKLAHAFKHAALDSQTDIQNIKMFMAISDLLSGCAQQCLENFE